MKKPAKRPAIPPRGSNNDKRRLIRAPDPCRLAALLQSVKYQGSSKHKLRPHLFGLEPFRGQRGDATLCDRDAHFRPEDLGSIDAMMKPGLRAGLVGRNEMIRAVLWIWVMTNFEIMVASDAATSWDDPQPISLRSGDICFTRLFRDASKALDDHLHAPPVQLAFWLIDNWWRLRWEPVVPDAVSPEWRLAHELSAIGGGYVWPRLRIWGEDTRVGLSSHGDGPQGMNFAVRYTTDALVFVSADQFETAVDRFLQQAVEARSEDRAALRAQLAALNGERNDQEAATWRRLEAQLGYDADEAPDHLIAAALKCIETYGRGGVEEAIVAVRGETSIETLREAVSIAERSRVTCDLREAVTAAGDVKRGPEVRIWESAEDAAMKVRRALGVDKGPLKNTRLKDLLKVSGEDFRARAGSTTKLSYGLRLRHEDQKRNVVALDARWPQNRRFEFSRTLGDAIWSGDDALGPMTRAKTRRQKFQRSFAQSLLCPYDDLMAYVNTDFPTEDDVAAAARHFHVSERVIQTLLVNKGTIDRQRFDEMVEAG